jgi:GMP synthase (glutamine-hydrolysing) A subunit
MIIVVNNSNRNREVLNNLRKSKRMMEGSKKCMTKKLDNQTRTKFVTDKLLDYLKKNNIPFKNVTSSQQMKKILKSKEKVDGIILGGSNLKYSNKLCACSINNNIISLLEFDVPILGICFGFQTLSMAYGGNVKAMKKMETRRKPVQLKKSKLFKGLDKVERFKFMHGDFVESVPFSFKVIAKTKNGMIQAIEHREKNIFGVQFHPEISGRAGEKLLDNFLKLCGQF